MVEKDQPVLYALGADITGSEVRSVCEMADTDILEPADVVTADFIPPCVFQIIRFHFHRSDSASSCLTDVNRPGISVHSLSG